MALIPPGYFESVVSLGVLRIEYEFTHMGTGFLYAHAFQKMGDRTLYRNFLVTNKHVAKVVSDARFNDATDRRLCIEPLQKERWSLHNEQDIAVMPLPANSALLKGRKLGSTEIILSDLSAPSKLDEDNISEGLGVFVLGFPMGLVGVQRNYPIVRGGFIARIRDYYRGETETFLIDAPAFPGNSGGPVILRPEHLAIKDTKNITHSLALGMISEYIPYRDVAISKQTGEPVSVLVENSGLAVVVPIQEIKKFVEESQFQGGKNPDAATG